MKKTFRVLAVIAVMLLIAAQSAFPEISVPSLISDGMVLQRDTRLNIW